MMGGIMAQRYTVKDLRGDLERINAALPDGLRMQEGGRNGYQAVDLYDAAGSCLRNVGCGTARECMGYAYQEAHNIAQRKAESK